MRSLLRLAVLGLLFVPALAAGQGPAHPVLLPKPATDGGRPLMRVLRERASSRVFRPDKLPLQTVANLLWAAFGVNRPDGHRTAPSAMNWQEIDIYVATADGAYLYDAKSHALTPVLTEDIRGRTGRQPFVKQAPLSLVYVADLGRMGKAPLEDKLFYAAADTGFIAENVYLFCASAGLATVVRGLLDRAALAKTLGLRPDQRITLSQTVGLPGK